MKNNYTKFEEDIDKSMNQITIFGTERNGTERNGSRILCGNSVEMLKTIPDGTVDCCVTSPPYYGLRDYGTGTWVGGDPSCPHYRTSKISDKTATGHKNMMETGHAV